MANSNKRSLVKKSIEKKKIDQTITANGNGRISHVYQSSGDINIFNGFGGLIINYENRIRNFLQDYIGDDENPVPFGGRDKEFQQLDNWLENPESPRYALLTSTAGQGKSALLCQWIAKLGIKSDAPHIIFFPVSSRYGTNEESAIFSSLAARTGYIYREKVAPSTNNQQYVEFFASLLHNPPKDGKPILIVIDGLDEAARWTLQKGVFPTYPPDHLRVLISARSLGGQHGVEDWLTRLYWNAPVNVELIKLGNLDKAGIRDVLRKKMGKSNPLDLTAIIDTLYYLTSGDPLLVNLYIKHFYEQKKIPVLSPETKDNILRANKVPGLKEFFESWENDQKKVWGEDKLQEKSVKGLLNLCSTAIGPLTRDDVIAIAPDFIEDTFALKRALDALGRFIIGDGRESGFVFNHPRLKEYFYDELTAREQQNWHTRFWNYCKQTLSDLKTGKAPKPTSFGYVTRFYTAHLKLISESADEDDYYNLLCPEWAQSWAEIDGTYAGFQNDIEAVWDYALKRKDIEHQILCCLCFSSIISLNSNISKELLALCIQNQILSARQALVILEKSGFEDGSAKIGYLINQCSDEQISEIMEITQDMGGWIQFAPPIMWVMHKLDGFFQNDDLVKKDIYPLISIQTLENLKNHVEKQPDPFRVILCLALFFMNPTEARYDELFSLLPLLTIDQAVDKISFLVELGIKMKGVWRDKILFKAVEIARSIPNSTDIDKKEVLVVLANNIPSNMVDSLLEIGLSIEDEYWRNEALTVIVPLMSDSARRNYLDKLAFSNMQLGEKCKLIAVFSKYFSVNQKWAILNYLRQLDLEEDHVKAVVGLVPYLQPEMLNATFDIATKTKNLEYKLKILANLSPKLEVNKIEEMVSKLLQEEDFSSLYYILDLQGILSISSYLEKNLRNSFIIKIFMSVKTEGEKLLKHIRLNNLLEIIQYLPAESQTAEYEYVFFQIKNIRDDHSFGAVVSKIAQCPIPRNLYGQLETLIQDVKVQHLRAQAISAYITCSAGEFSNDIVDMIFDLHWAQSNEIIEQKFSLLSKNASVVLKRVLALPEETPRKGLISSLLPQISYQLVRDLILPHLIAEEEDYRSSILTKLAENYSGELMNDHRAIIYTLQNLFLRYNVFFALFLNLTGELKRQAFDLSLKTALEIPVDKDRCQAITQLTPFIEKTNERKSLLENALSASKMIDDSEEVVFYLSELQPNLPEKIQHMLLDYMNNWRLEKVGDIVLIYFISKLPLEKRVTLINLCSRSIQNVLEPRNKVLNLLRLAYYCPHDVQVNLIVTALALCVERRQQDPEMLYAFLSDAKKIAPELIARQVDDLIENYRDDSSIAQHRLYRLASFSVQQQILKQVFDDALSKSNEFRFEVLSVIVFDIPDNVPQEIVDQIIACILKDAERNIIGKISVYKIETSFGILKLCSPDMQKNIIENVAATLQSIQNETVDWKNVFVKIPQKIIEDNIADLLSLREHLILGSEKINYIKAIIPWCASEVGLLLRQEWLSLIEDIGYEKSKVDELVEFMPFMLSEQFDGVLSVIDCLQYDHLREDLISRIISYLNPQQSAAILKKTQQVGDGKWRNKIETHFIHILPGDLQVKTIENNLALLKDDLFTKGVSSLGDALKVIRSAKEVSAELRQKYFDVVLREAAYHPRKDLLTLLPDIYNLSCELNFSSRIILAENITNFTVSVSNWWR